MHEILEEAALLQHEKEAVQWSDEQGCSLVYIVRDNYAEQLATQLHLRPMEVTELHKAIGRVSARAKQDGNDSRARNDRQQSRDGDRFPPVLTATAKRLAAQPPRMVPPTTDAPRGSELWCSEHNKPRSANKLEFYQGKWYCKPGQPCIMGARAAAEPEAQSDDILALEDVDTSTTSPPRKKAKKEQRERRVSRPTQMSDRELMRKIMETVADTSKLKGLVGEDGYWSLNQLMTRWASGEGHTRKDVVHAVTRNLLHSSDPTKLRFAIKPSRSSKDILVRVVPKE